MNEYNLSTNRNKSHSLLSLAHEYPVQRSVTHSAFGPNELTTDVYALGRISAKWPNKSIEQEFRCSYDVINKYDKDIKDPNMNSYRDGRAPFWVNSEQTLNCCTPSTNSIKNEGKAWKEEEERNIINTVLSSRYFRYLARELDWKLQDLYHNDMYRLIPSEYNMQLLINALAKSKPSEKDEALTVNSLVVGQLVPTLGHENTIKISRFHQVDAQEIANNASYLDCFDSQNDLINVIHAYLVLAKNNGLADEERALNYILCYGYSFYQKMYKQRSQTSSYQAIRLVNIDARVDYVGERTLVCVIFNFQDSKTNATEAWSSTVDVTETFPFMVAQFEPYINIL
ncbi:hypothetical protein [Marinomonas sp.]|uniref:cyanobactin maturation protease PatG family protein n=1 Tax=Marinomonas sp. TaxID=1904862 RepID=UPI003BABBF44